MENPLVFHYEAQDFIDAFILIRNTGFTPVWRVLKILGVFILVLLIVFFGLYVFSNFVTNVSSGTVQRLTTLNGFIEFVWDLRDGLRCLSFLLVPTVLLALVSEPTLRFRYWLMIRKNPDVIQDERKFTFSEAGVNYSTSSTESNIKWDYFSHAIEGRRHFILVKNRDSYFIVPKRAFSSSSDEAKFRDYVTMRLGTMQKRM